MGGELLDLAQRCEAATDPDRRLDAQIAWLVVRPAKNDFDRSYSVFAQIITKLLDGGDDCEIERYTASLDAAMTLVPDGQSFEIRASGIGDKGQAFVWDPMTQPGFSSHRSWRVTGCASPALALCAAALRARSA